MLGTELIGVGEAKILEICEFVIGKSEDTIAGLELEGCGIAIGIGGGSN